MDRINVVQQQRFICSDSDNSDYNIDNTGENTEYSNQLSEGDDYNRVYFYEEGQNEQNEIEYHEQDLSDSEIESVVNPFEIISVHSDDSSDSLSSQAEEDIDSISSARSDSSNEEQVHFANENEKARSVAIAIGKWAREPGRLSKKKLDDLLLKLHPAFPNLPLSYKTILQTPGINLIPVNGGKLYKSV